MRDTDHPIDWESARPIAYEKTTSRRKLREAIYIRALDSSRTNDGLMNQDKGLHIHSSWDCTYSVIQKKLDRQRERSQKHLGDQRQDSSTDEEIPTCSLMNL